MLQDEDDEPLYHRPAPPTPPKKSPEQISSAVVPLQDIPKSSNPFEDDEDEQSPVNSPAVNTVLPNKQSLPPKPILKKQPSVIQQTGCCSNCSAPILYTPLGDSETLVKCYNCPQINSFTGPDGGSEFEESSEPNSRLTKDTSKELTNLNNKFKGAFRTMRNTATKTGEAMKSSNFMKVAAERTAVAAQQAKVAAQKASQTTKVAAQKASQTTKEATKAAAQRAKHTLQRANAQEEEVKAPPEQPGEETRIFGVPLEDAVQKSSTIVPGVPDVVAKCVDYLRKRALKEEGIFRISGSQQTIKDYKLAFDKGENPDLNGISDEHVVSGLLKLYFRELPDPLFTRAIPGEVHKLENVGDKDSVVPQLASLINQLPKPNYIILKYLLGLLAEVSKHERENKMTVQNLGIVFAPTLGCPMETIGPLIKHYDQVYNFNLIDL